MGPGDALDAEASHDCLMPPEFFSAKPTGVIAKLPPSPVRLRNERGGHGDREAADVWGIGTLAFELATGRISGTKWTFFFSLMYYRTSREFSSVARVI